MGKSKDIFERLAKSADNFGALMANKEPDPVVGGVAKPSDVNQINAEYYKEAENGKIQHRRFE